jgi:hypothetical protein
MSRKRKPDEYDYELQYNHESHAMDMEVTHSSSYSDTKSDTHSQTHVYSHQEQHVAANRDDIHQLQHSASVKRTRMNSDFQIDSSMGDTTPLVQLPNNNNHSHNISDACSSIPVTVAQLQSSGLNEQPFSDVLKAVQWREHHDGWSMGTIHVYDYH